MGELELVARNNWSDSEGGGKKEPGCFLGPASESWQSFAQGKGLGDIEVMVGGEGGRGVPRGGRQPGGRGRGGKEGGNGQIVENKASRVLSHQNLVVGLDASMEDKFSGRRRGVIEKLLGRMSIGRKMKAAMLLLVKVFEIDHWMIGKELMLEQLSSERELLGGESLSL